MLPTNRGFWLTIILSIVTLGIYQWYLVYAFARETNIACRRDGQNTTGLFLFIILTIITFGIYSIVWYCKWISRCNTYLAVNGQPQGLQVSTYLLSIFFGWLYTRHIQSCCLLQNALSAKCGKQYLQQHHRMHIRSSRRIRSRRSLIIV